MSDLNQVSRMAKMFGGMVPGMDVKPLVEELRQRVAEELDYLRESQSQRAFAVAFEGDPEFAVPHILAAAPMVLVSEWIDGVSLSHVIADGTREERDKYATLYQRFVLSGPSRAGLLHADPHPGNYRVTQDGKLAVLDFGAVAHLPDGLPSAMGYLLRLAMDNDAQGVMVGLRREGFIKSDIMLEAQALLDYLSPLVEPARHEVFHYNRKWLRGEFLRLRDPRSEEFTVGLKLNLPPNYLLIHRVWLGCVGVLCQLDANVATRDEIERWVPGFAQTAQ
jgi:predicted unusual protein kinase regulating ubiquinone biosynthesis (AarF/ABC1/UbiB family)